MSSERLRTMACPSISETGQQILLDTADMLIVAGRTCIPKNIPTKTFLISSSWLAFS